MKKIIFTFVFFILFPFIGNSIESKMSDNDLPVKINADDMVYDINRSQVTFTGNVVVTRGTFIMNAPKMTIFLKENNTKQKIEVKNENIPLTGKVNTPKKTVNTQNKIDKIEAYNGVKFKFDKQSGSSQTATYNANKGILTMRGNPVVKDGNNSIQGTTILYYLYERRSEVVGSGKKRVEAIFDPNK